MKKVHPCMSEPEMRALARMPALTMSQIAEIIQGFTPTGKVGDHFQYLDNYGDDIRVVRSAIQRGEITHPATPRALATFCVKSGVPLPAEFFEEVTKDLPRSSRLAALTRFTDEHVRPNHKRDRKGDLSVRRNPKRVGRTTPSTYGAARVQGRDHDIQKLAHSIAIDSITKRGRMPAKKQMAYEIAATTKRSFSDISRRFSVVGLVTPAERASAKRAYYQGKGV